MIETPFGEQNPAYSFAAELNALLMRGVFCFLYRKRYRRFLASVTHLPDRYCLFINKKQLICSVLIFVDLICESNQF